jgi:hypothetical protein
MMAQNFYANFYVTIFWIYVLCSNRLSFPVKGCQTQVKTVANQAVDLSYGVNVSTLQAMTSTEKYELQPKAMKTAPKRPKLIPKNNSDKMRPTMLAEKHLSYKPTREKFPDVIEVLHVKSIKLNITGWEPWDIAPSAVDDKLYVAGSISFDRHFVSCPLKLIICRRCA